MIKYFLKSKENLLKEFSTTLEGLTENQVKQNKETYGVNELEKTEQKFFNYISFSI